MIQGRTKRTKRTKMDEVLAGLTGSDDVADPFIFRFWWTLIRLMAAASKKERTPEEPQRAPERPGSATYLQSALRLEPSGASEK